MLGESLSIKCFEISSGAHTPPTNKPVRTPRRKAQHICVTAPIGSKFSESSSEWKFLACQAFSLGVGFIEGPAIVSAAWHDPRRQLLKGPLDDLE